jgi:hypothetical protein
MAAGSIVCLMDRMFQVPEACTEYALILEQPGRLLHNLGNGTQFDLLQVGVWAAITDEKSRLLQVLRGPDCTGGNTLWDLQQRTPNLEGDGLGG